MLWCRHIFMVGSLTLTSLSCNLSFVLLTRCGLIGLWSVPCCLYILYNKHCTDDYFELDCWMSAFFTKNCQQCKKIVCEKKRSYDEREFYEMIQSAFKKLVLSVITSPMMAKVCSMFPLIYSNSITET
jgi:hypothetical protein